MARKGRFFLLILIAAAYQTIETEYVQMLVVSGLPRKDAVALASLAVFVVEGAMTHARATRSRVPLKLAAQLLAEKISTLAPAT